MKKSLLFLGVLFLFTSCHIDHKIASLKITGQKKSSKIEFCLEEPIGSERYHFVFDATLKDGRKVSYEDWVGAHPNHPEEQEKKCFRFTIEAYWRYRHTKEEYDKWQLVYEIYEGNVKEMKVTIYYYTSPAKTEKIRTQIFTNL